MNFDRILFYGGLILMVIFTTPLLFEYVAGLTFAGWTFAGASYVISFIKVCPILYLIVGVAASSYLLVDET